MATPTLAQQAAIANLYIALFNRAPDAEGFAFWTQALANGASIDVLARGFVQTPEAQAIYPVSQTAAQFVTTYYANVLGRPIDPSGLAFWTGMLESSGGVNSNLARALVVSKIVEIVNTPLPVKPDGLTDEAYALTFADRNAFKNKGEIAIFYATEYKGTDLNLAKQVLSVVGPASTTIDAAKALLNPPTGGGGTPPVVGPQHFIGTTGVDNFVGGNADDTFTFVINTTTPGFTTLGNDTLTGAAGDDTLNVTTTGTVTKEAFTAAAISGIETLALTRTAASSVTVAAWAGLSNVNVNGGTGNLLVEDLAGGAKVSLNDSAGGTVMMRYLNGATGATTLALTGNVIGQGVEVQTTGLSSLTLTSTGSANALANLGIGSSVSTLKIVADTALSVGALVATKLNVEISGTATVNLATLTNPSVRTIDASDNNGGLTVALSSGNSIVTIKGSSGNDLISIGSAELTGSVDAGAGTADRLIVNAAGTLTAATGLRYTNFEILRVENGVTVDLEHISDITSVEINDGAGATSVSNLSAAQAAAVTILGANGGGAISIGLKDVSGTSDTVKATVATGNGGSGQPIDLTGLTLTGVEKLELTGNESVLANNGLLTLTTTNAPTLKSIVVKHASATTIRVNDTHTATGLSIDASESTGPVTINVEDYATTTGATIKGGLGTNTLTGSGKADTFYAGATSVLGASFSKMTGHNGRNTFVFSAADNDTAHGRVTAEITDFLSGFDKINLTIAGPSSIAAYKETGIYSNMTDLYAGADATLDGTVKVFVGQFAGTSYVIADANGTGYTEVIKLTGVILGNIAFTDFVQVGAPPP